ncbi:fimbrial protein [Cupriavidus sp. UME77]|uniref:fimbrial protein n=1 Tax=Cupriavidus sp. UME77 TaxID=1862321 RepID=UPI001602BDFB
MYEPKGKVVSGATYTENGQTYSIFETGAPGIGYVLGGRAATASPTPPASSAWVPIGPGPTVVYTGNANVMRMEHRIILVVSGRLVSGSYTIPIQAMADVRPLDAAGKQLNSDTPALQVSGPINVTTRGCKVTSGATNAVALPTLISHSLQSVGAVSDVSASFSIGVNCDGNVGLYATLTDASNPTNTSNALTLAGSSTATGVGIQMFRSGATTPLGLGPDSSAKGNTNQWSVGRSSASGGNINIPLTAKYVKTEPTIKPGTVKARSTITFSYQ